MVTERELRAHFGRRAESAYLERCRPYQVRMACGHLETRLMRESTAGAPWTPGLVIDVPTAPCAACASTSPEQVVR